MEKESKKNEWEKNLETLGIDRKKLESEQEKYAKEIKLKDIKLDEIKTVGGCFITYILNKILVTIVVMDRNFEIIDKKFVIEKPEFPYTSGFLAYRELPALMRCWEKIEEVPDILIVNRNGILHPRKFGLASQFGLSIEKPVIGISLTPLCGEIKENKVYLGKEIIGEEFRTKTGSKPVYISPGHLISLKSSIELTKQFLKAPHKLPEPLDAANRYANKIKEEFLKKV